MKRPAQTAPTASVVVVNWNGLRFLEECFAHLRRQEVRGGFEVIMVDNGSSDGSVAWVREVHPEIRVIETGRNLGFSKGSNLGLRAATGRYAVLLDNDTRVQPGWLQALVDAADADPRVGSVGSKVLMVSDLWRDCWREAMIPDPDQGPWGGDAAGFQPPDSAPAIINHAGLLVLSDGSTLGRGYLEPDLGQWDQPEEIFGPPSTAALYRREALEQVGLLDETFFAYYDDTDLAWRLRLAGWTAVYQPRAVVEHVHNGTGGRNEAFLLYHVNRNRLLLMLKCGSPRAVLKTFSRFSWQSYAPEVPPWLALRVVAGILRRVPEMLLKRRRVRALARVPDAAIERWLVSRDIWEAEWRRHVHNSARAWPNERFMRSTF